MNLGSIKLENFILKMAGGATPLGANYLDIGVPFLRVQNIMQNYFNLNDIVYISKADDEILKRSRLNRGDMLLTITGAYGKAAVVEQDLENANINQHSVKIETKDINPYFLATFINSKYGQLQCDKKITGVTRPALDYQVIRDFLIPQFSQDFQLEIQKLVQDSHKALEDSKRLYKEAQELLYKELELDFKNPLKSLLKSSLQAKKTSELAIINDISKKYPHLNISVRPLLKSLHKSGRLDSEYYQSKYDLMETKIKSKGFKTLQEICSLINYGSVPTSPYTENGEGIPYIKGLNLKNLEINEYKLDRIINTENLDSRFFTKENDIIISQMGTVGDCGVVSKAQENYIFASFTIRIRLKNAREFNPYFIALYIQYIAKEWYLLRNIAQASVRQNTDLPTIRNLYVPLINPATQEQIALKIQKSFTLRAKSKDLLQNAKIKLENAIENG